MPRKKQATDLANRTPPTPVPSIEEIARIEQLVRWITTGASYTEIIEQTRKEFPDQVADALYQKAVEVLRTTGDVDPAILRGFAIESAREIYRRLMEAGDLANALRALKMLADFQT